jgi:hypothetical protein
MSKKLVLLVILTFVMLSASLLATESRMAAMGGMNGYVKDNTDIFIYPGTIFSYEKFVTMEMREAGTTASWSLGANMPLWGGILGVYFNEPTYFNVDDYLDWHSDYDDGDLDISKKLDIFYGIKDGLAVGIGIAGSAVSPYKELKESANYIDLKAGMSTDKLDTGIVISLPMGKVEETVTKEKVTFFNMGVGLNGRLYLIQKENWSLAGLVGLGFRSNTVKYTPGTDVKANPKGTESIIDFNLGLGINYNVTESTLLVFGIRPLGLDLYTAKQTPGDYKDSETTIVVPEYKVGIESQLLPWFIIRAGITQTYVMFSDKVNNFSGDEVYNFKAYDSMFDSELGLGFKFGDFVLDTVICDQFLFDGPDFIGGTAPGINTKLSLGYNF